MEERERQDNWLNQAFVGGLIALLVGIGGTYYEKHGDDLFNVSLNKNASIKPSVNLLNQEIIKARARRIDLLSQGLENLRAIQLKQKKLLDSLKNHEIIAENNDEELIVSDTLADN